MSKKLVVLGITTTVLATSLILINSPAYASLVLNNSNTPAHEYQSFKIPQNREQQAIKEKIDKAVDNFKQKVDEDIIASTNTDLNGFQKLTAKDLFNDTQYREYIYAFAQVMNRQQPGDVIPTLYVKDDVAYILEKRANGQNKVYQLLKVEGQWKHISIIEKPGIYIQPPII